MKIWAIFLCILILLCGCDASMELERGMALRSALLKSEGYSMDATITVDYEDSSCGFSLSCTYDKTGEMTFSVLLPESIEGITGKIDEDNGSITFDDTALFFALLPDDRLSPVSAPWICMKALRNGYIRAVATEGEYIRLTIDDSYEDDALQVDVWIDEKEKPVYAEILLQGRRILSMKIENTAFL